MGHLRGKVLVGIVASGMLAVPGAAFSPATGAAGSAGSSGEVAAEACDYTYKWIFTNIREVHKKAPGNTFKDGPGGSMTAEVRRESTIQHSVAATVGASGGPPFVEVKAEVTAQAQKSRTVSLGHSYTRSIPRGRYGHLAYGSWSKKFTYKRIGRAERPCPTITVAKGTAVYPTNAVGWRFWTSRS